MCTAEETEDGITVDELLQSVLQTKTKLGGRMRSFLLRRSGNAQGNVVQTYNKDYTDPSMPSSFEQINSRNKISRTPSTSKTVVFRSLSTFKNNFSEISDLIIKDLSQSTNTSMLDLGLTSASSTLEPIVSKSQNIVRTDLTMTENNTTKSELSKHSTNLKHNFIKASSTSNLKSDVRNKTKPDLLKASSTSNLIPDVNRETSVDLNTFSNCGLTKTSNKMENDTKKDVHAHNCDLLQTPVNQRLEFFKTPNTSNSYCNKPSGTSGAMMRSQPRSPSLKLHNTDIIEVNGFNYLKFKKLGRGGSSVVYEVLDLSTKERKAIKIVSLDADEDTKLSYKNEIKILKKLQYSSRVIKVFDYEETPSQLKIVLEAGQIDLAQIIKEARQNNTKIPAFSIQHYWQEMLLAVQVIHKEGIIHADLKPANFLLVNGTFKLIDFGIASSVQQDMTSVFKDSQSGTFNYMSPESLNDVHKGPIFNKTTDGKVTIKISVKSDVWSLGCILYNLVYGKTPFQDITNPLMKCAAISNANTVITFPPVNNKNLLDVMQKCLQFNPYKRPSIRELLAHPYLDGNLTSH